MSSDPVVRARGLGKAYPIYERPSDRLAQMLTRGRLRRPRPFWAVRGVDLDLHAGETVGIVGRNGSGKSTLLEMIGGTLEPTEGQLEVHGRAAALLELGAGFNPDFSGLENVRLNAAILGLDPDELDRCFDEIVRFADIGPFVEQPVKTYSSGMYARLAFAVAIHANPDLLVVDEILSVGDEAFQRKCFAKIEAIKRRGCTILLVSHTAATILELCDRAVLLDAGEQLLCGAPKTVVTLYQRLLYTPAEEALRVRAEIRRRAQAGGGAPGAPLDATAPGPGVVDRNEEERAYFDPSLQSTSVIRYEVNGAEIQAPTLHTRDGVRVNCLAMHRRYVLRYEVRFEKDAFDVHYHTLLKTVTGLELGGGTYPAIGTVGGEARAGSTVTVEFEFTCNLNPGVYFLNCGVTGCGGQQLHRIIDAVAMRVLPEPARTTFGHVSFAHRATVSHG